MKKKEEEEEKVDDTSDELDFYSDKETEVGNYPIAEPIIEKKLEPEKVNPFAFLDEYEAEKKKQGRGQALWEGAAAAIDWGTSGTAKERSKAISTGLRKVGTIGAKYKGEAMDLRAKAKILGAVEDIKGEHKLEEWDKKLKEYYGKSIGIQEEELELKKEIQELKKKNLTNKQIYDQYVGTGKLNSPIAKINILSSIIGKQIQTAANEKEVKQFSTPENDGVIFMDTKGILWRNTKGNVKVIDIWQDTEFLGE